MNPPVCGRRPTRTFWVPTGGATACRDSAAPAIVDAARQSNPAPPPVLTTRERVPHATAAAAGHVYDRTADAENRVFVQLSPLLPIIVLRLYSVNPGAIVASRLTWS